MTALAGAMSLNAGAVMGIAMGTSEAAGYVTGDGKILGWFNELAFAPVDLQPDAPQDEWSQDYGVGCKYFSQDAVIRLAPRAGIALDEGLSLAEKLKEVQKLAEAGHEGARKIFVTIGSYLGHTLPLYARFYDLKVLLVLGSCCRTRRPAVSARASPRPACRRSEMAVFTNAKLFLPGEGFVPGGFRVEGGRFADIYPAGELRGPSICRAPG